MREWQWWTSAGIMALLLVAVFALNPLWAVVLGGTLLTVGGGAALLARFPSAMLRAAVAAVPLAATKFRIRDPLLSTAGVIDAQILYELGMYAVIAAIVLRVRFSRVYAPRALHWVEWSLVVFVALAIASTGWSPTAALTFVRGTQMAILLALVMTAIRVWGSAGLVRTLLTSAFIYVVVFAGLAVAIPAVRAGHYGLAHEATRFTWFSMHPIWVATYASIVILYLVWTAAEWFRDRGAARAVWPMAAVVGLLTLVLATRSRGTLVALAAALAFFLATRFLTRKGLAVIVVGGITVVAGFVVADISPADWIRSPSFTEAPGAEFLLRGQTPDEFLEFSGRVELWEACVVLIRERPIIGHGYLSSRVLFVDLISWIREGGYAHNAFLQTALDLGAIGTVLLWVPLVLAAFPSREGAGPRRLGLLVSSLAVFLIVNAVGSESFAAAPTFETLAAFTVIVAAPRLRRRERDVSATGGTPTDAATAGRRVVDRLETRPTLPSSTYPLASRPSRTSADGSGSIRRAYG